MANKRPGGLRQPKTIRVRDGDVSSLAGLFVEVPHFLDKLPLVAKARGFDATQTNEILHWLGAVHECSPTTWRFVKGIIADAYPGTRLAYKPVLEGNDILQLGLKMLAEVQRQRLLPRPLGSRPPALSKIIANRAFKKLFPMVGGKSRNRDQITEDYARKLIQKAKAHIRANA